MKHFSRVLVIVMLLVAFLMGACSVGTVKAEQNRPIKIWYQNENGQYKTLCVVDEETGVNYIVVAAVSLYGDKTTTVAITPRLNADGSLYTD